jgi:competence protein ComEA
VPDDQPDDAVDPRAEAALHRLRSASPADEGRGEHEWPDRGPWAEHARRLLEQRWPAIGERPVVVVAVVATIAVLVLGGGWIMVTGTAGPVDGGGGSLRLPFTTTTEAAGPSAAGGPVSSPGSTTLVALVVHAAGAVQQPGVHRVPNGARVADVLAAAGGPSPDADVDRLNLAAVVSDGQRLYVPRVGESAPPVAVGPEGSAAATGAGGATGGPAVPLDLNQATETELDVLPGVGPSTAAAIVAHREANGPFRRVDDLLEVRGIGPAKLEALRDLVRIG